MYPIALLAKPRSGDATLETLKGCARPTTPQKKYNVPFSPGAATMINASTSRFTLCPRSWYAMEFVGDEFFEIPGYRSSPIFVESLVPAKSGNRQFTLSFYHANYPEGVRNKIYNLQTIERGERFILVRSTEHNPTRIMHIFAIDWEWLLSRFTIDRPDREREIGVWLSSNWG